MTKKKRHLIIDLAIIFFSIIVAIIMARSGAVPALFFHAQGREIMGSFLAGMLFVSAFTVAPAGVMLVQIAQENSLWLVSLFGGLGGLIGDILIFTFVKDRVAEDLMYLLHTSGWQRWLFMLRLRMFRWLAPLLGAVIIASPLPDEIGLALLGISKVPRVIFIPLAFGLNFFGILVMLAIAQVVL